MEFELEIPRAAGNGSQIIELLNGEFFDGVKQAVTAMRLPGALAVGFNPDEVVWDGDVCNFSFLVFRDTSVERSTGQLVVLADIVGVTIKWPEKFSGAKSDVLGAFETMIRNLVKKEIVDGQEKEGEKG